MISPKISNPRPAHLLGLTLLLALWLAAVAPAHSQQATTATTTTATASAIVPGSKPCPIADADIWVLAGQSNMQGAGKMKETVPVDPRIMLFNMDNTWIEAQEPLHRMFESVAPVHRTLMYQSGVKAEDWDKARDASKKAPNGGVGPGLFFAREVIKTTNHPIGLIAAAHGGTSLAQWDPALKDKGGDSLYGAMIDRIKMVGGGQKIKGILWYQGESDAMSDACKVYDTKFLEFVDAVRRDTERPDLPIITVQISRFVLPVDNQSAGWELIRDVQRRVAPQRKNLWVVPAADLPLDDIIHISYEGHQRLGRRMAEVALKYVYNLADHATPIDLDAIKVEDPQAGQARIHVKFKGVNGKLQAAGRPNGFRLRSPSLPVEQVQQVFRVEFDPQDPASVILTTMGPLKGPLTLIYAPGLDPYVNIVDDKDMAVPAFGPAEIPLQP